MRTEKKRSRGRWAAEAGASVLIRVMLLLLAIVLLLMTARVSYTAGYRLFQGGTAHESGAKGGAPEE